MSELRRNRLTGGWTVYAPGRAVRPRDGGGDPAGKAGRALPRHATDCPFCPGNEDRIPVLLYQRDAPSPPGWRTRAIANRYPIIDASAPETGEALIGRHEVIVEHPRHDLDPADMTTDEMAAVLDCWRVRIAALWEEPDTMAVVLFRNRGHGAGVSLIHPHSQLLSLATAPPVAARLEKIAAGHFSSRGECLTCSVLAEELAGPRVVARAPGFVAFVPFAAQAPCECWIMPERHEIAFHAIAAAEIDALSRMLTDVLRALRAHGGDPDYNMVLHTPSRAADPRVAHWWLRILPRHGHAGGFELGAGVEIDSSLPEADAARLRGEM